MNDEGFLNIYQDNLLINIEYRKREGVSMVYEHMNKKSSKLYYLHQKGHLFFFSSKKEGGIDLPKGYKVIENTKTGLPMLKKA